MKKQIYLLLGLLMVSVLFVSAAPGDAFIDPVTKSVSGSFDLVVKGDLKAGSVATIDAAFAFDARPLNFSITKNVFSMFMSAIIMFLLFLAVARSYKKNPKGPY